MPSLTVNLDGSGKPVVEVEARMNFAQEQQHHLYGLTVPAPVILRALVDTGASRSLIERTVLEQLDLDVVGTLTLVTPSSGPAGVPMNLYVVGLLFHGIPGLIATNLAVGVVESLEGFDVQMLLGRDILKGGVLDCDGERGEFSLSMRAVTRPH